jgi:hypothetical protein
MKKQLNKEMVRRLADGEIVLHNSDGTLEKLQEILKAAAPKDKVLVRGKCSYYGIISGEWSSFFLPPSTPSFPISAFYEEKEEQKQFPRWMWVNTKNDIGEAIRRFVLAHFNDRYWFIADAETDRELLNNYKTIPWQFAWEEDEKEQKKQVTFEVTEEQEKEIKKLLENGK